MARPWKPSIEEYDKCNRRARRDGLFAGASGGLFAAIFGQRAFKFDRNKSLFAGLLAGALSGYFFSQAFLTSYVSQLEREASHTAAAREAGKPDAHRHQMTDPPRLPSSSERRAA